MDRFQAMSVFVAVADAGSLTGAAQTLGLSPPAVTRSLAALESHVGLRLFHRTTRALRLTEAGASYLQDCRRILGEVEEAEETLRGVESAARGPVSVTAPVLFGQLHVMPALRDFLDRHPKVQARVLLLDRVVSLVEEGIDVGIRLGELPDSSLYAMPVGQVRRVVCASPEYLRRHGRPTEPSELRSHRLIFQEASRGWRFSGGMVGRLDPALTVNSNQAALDAAAAGWGVARLVSYQVASLVEQGRLELLLEEHELPAWPVHLVYQEGRRMPARVRLLLDFLRERLRESPALR